MKNKYGAKKTTIDGIVFDSIAESRRYTELKLLERARKITALVLQPRYQLVVNGHLIGGYKPDFEYIDTETGKRVVEDVKGMASRDFVLRKKLMKAIHGIEITIIGGRKPAKKRSVKK